MIQIVSHSLLPLTIYSPSTALFLPYPTLLAPSPLTISVPGMTAPNACMDVTEGLWRKREHTAAWHEDVRSGMRGGGKKGGK